MKVLLDTHALIWWLIEPNRLPSLSLATIKDAGNSIFVSAVSAMQLTTKHRLGKLPIVNDFIDNLKDTLVKCDFELLPIEFEDAFHAGQLITNNRDPFDRLLIAQAIRQGITLISNEADFDKTNVTRLWD
jgi:PIN domain nuclease of toxin-antitoxin system